MAANIEVTIDVPKSGATSGQQAPPKDQQRRVHEEEFRYYGTQRHVEEGQEPSPPSNQRQQEYHQQQQDEPPQQPSRPQQQAARQQQQQHEHVRQEDEERWRQQQEAAYMPQPERYVADGDRYLLDQRTLGAYEDRNSRSAPQESVQQQHQHGEHESRRQGEKPREQQQHHHQQRLPSPPRPREQIVYVPVAQNQYQQQQNQFSGGRQQQQQHASPRASGGVDDRRERRFSSSSLSEQDSRSRVSSVSFDQHQHQQQHEPSYPKQRERVVMGSAHEQHDQQHHEHQQPIRTKRSSSLEASKLVHRVGGSLKVTPERIGVVIAGWPNELAIQCAKACVKRGYRMLPVGICMNDSEDDRVDITDVCTVILYRYGDSQLGPRLAEQLNIAAEKLDLFPVIIDTSLQVDNLRLYHQFKVPFVFETRADSLEDHQRAIRETESARCFALIAQRMDKHVAAVDSLFEDMARRFPGLFAEPLAARRQSSSSNTRSSSSFEFALKTSEPNEKVNRGLLNAVSDLLNKDIGMGSVQHVSTREETEHHGLVAQPQTTKEPHVKRVYEIKNGTGSSVFHFEQDVNATYECAEGVADSVTFIAQKAQEMARPRVYDILDVANSSRFLTW